MTHHQHKILFSFIGLALIGGLVFLGFGTRAQAEDPKGLQKSEIHQIVKDYLMDNPEIIVESMEQYKANEEEREEKQAAAKMGKHMSYLTAASAPSAGSADADITIVEFFDYNCGYCKRALLDIQKVLNDDKKVRFVFQEMPILGPTSRTAAKWALAAHKQGKYFEYHAALMNHRGSKNEAELSKLAKATGLDAEQMKKDANSTEVKDMLNKSLDVAREIGIQGTPAFILNGELMRGYMGPDGMIRAIKAARKGKNKEG